MSKHKDGPKGSACNQGGYGKCKCRVPRATLKTPNARLFSYRNDDAGSALFKGVGRLVEEELADEADWVAGCAARSPGEAPCGAEPVTIHQGWSPEVKGEVFTPLCADHSYAGAVYQ